MMKPFYAAARQVSLQLLFVIRRRMPVWCRRRKRARKIGQRGVTASGLNTATIASGFNGKQETKKELFDASQR